ncbi:MAG: hypothetical protein NVS3B19_15600 [Ginsengibacter sp.]
MLPIGHTEPILHAEFSNNAKLILTTSYDNTVKIWDGLTGTLLMNFKNFPDYLFTAHFSPDSKRMVTAGFHSTSKVWDVYTGALLLDLHEEASKAQFSPKGDGIVTFSFLKDTVKFWNSSTGKLLEQVGVSGNLQFSPDGRKVVKYTNNSVTIKDALTGESLLLKNLPTNGMIGDEDVEFSPDGQKIIIAPGDDISGMTEDEIFKLKKKYCSAKVFNTTNGKLLLTLKGHSDHINTALFSPNGQKIVTSSDDETVKIWDSKSGDLITNFHIDGVSYAVFSPDNQSIITCSKDGSSRVWNASTKQLMLELTGHSNHINNAEFSPDDTKIVTGSDDGKVNVWGATEGRILLNFKGHSEQINSVTYSHNGKKFVTSSGDGTAKIWDAQKGNMLLSLNSFSDEVFSAHFSPDDKRIITASNNYYSTKIWNSSTGKLILTLNRNDDYPNISAQFSPDGKKIVTTSNGDLVKVWDASTGALLHHWGGPGEGETYSGQFSPDGKKILTSDGDNVMIREANTGKKLLLIDNSYANVSVSAYFNPDGSKIIAAYFRSNPKVWDATSGKLLQEVKDDITGNGFAKFSNDGKKIVSTGDFMSKVWNVENGHLIFEFMQLDNSEYFSRIPTGYYICTPNAAKLLHYVTNDLKVITFEQLDIKYNRPDKVLQAIGFTDTVLINSYRKAYEKRIKKLGIDTTSFKEGFGLPEADFENRNNISSEQQDKQLKLHIQGKDTIYLLDRFNVWVNEVPLFGLKGINLKNDSTHKLDTTITISLSDNTNIVETSITNVNGTESYRMPLKVNYTPKQKANQRLHFIGIGIDKFSESTHNLQWSVKDIKNLSNSLKKKYGEDIVIHTLFNEGVTADSVMALKKELLKSSINDQVIIAYSGHGLLSDSLEYYLSTYNVNFKKPEEGGLPYDALEDLMDGIPARKKLMLIDACHSGEVDKEEMQKYKQVKDDLTNEGTKGAILVNIDSAKIGMKNSFELMQELFVNVGRNTGATIISAAGGTQFAQESGELQNGVFTYSILEYMKDHPSATVTELKQHVNKRVPELTKGLQKPTTRTENKLVDWRVW